MSYGQDSEGMSRSDQIKHFKKRKDYCKNGCCEMLGGLERPKHFHSNYTKCYPQMKQIGPRANVLVLIYIRFCQQQQKCFP